MTDVAIRIHAFMVGLKTSLRGFIDDLKEETGQDLLEYALIGGLAAAAILVGVAILGPGVTSMFNNMRDCVDFESSTVCNISLP